MNDGLSERSERKEKEGKEKKKKGFVYSTCTRELQSTTQPTYRRWKPTVRISGFQISDGKLN